MNRIKYNDEIEYIIDLFNNKCYYKIDTKICHRLDGPACEFTNGDKYWLQNDQYHRIDGPAIEYPNGYKEYWINGKLLK